MIAQLSVFPIGEGTSLSRFVKKGVAVIEESGYSYEVGGIAKHLLLKFFSRSVSS
jgi:uncharacterized protein YqgV (UPF0045/DUF77 family)